MYYFDASNHLQVKSREFSNIQLVSNIEELISLLIDKECLEAFKWPSISVDEVFLLFLLCGYFQNGHVQLLN